MADLKDIMAYLIGNYPKSMSSELSNARLTKMVYLSDWHSCLRGKGQISSIKWYFDNYGPYVDDIKDTANEHPEVFKTSKVPNMYGSTKRLFELVGETEPSLTPSEKKSLDHIITICSKKNWNSFIKLVYSTFPISSSDRYEYLNLVIKAEEYKSIRDAI